MKNLYNSSCFCCGYPKNKVGRFLTSLSRLTNALKLDTQFPTNTDDLPKIARSNCGFPLSSLTTFLKFFVDLVKCFWSLSIMWSLSDATKTDKEWTDLTAASTLEYTSVTGGLHISLVVLPFSLK